MTEITFGTDGWRGEIAEDFTFDNVRAVAQATAEHMHQAGTASKGVVVGYDTRFASEFFAQAVAEVMAANDIHTALTASYGPTPALSHSILHRGVGAGVMITASHNPGRWNGFKVKEGYGGSSPPDVTRDIQGRIPAILDGAKVRRMALGEAQAKGLVEEFDQRAPYLAALRNLVDIEAIRNAGLRILVDPMYGTGIGMIADLLRGASTEVEEIHGMRNPAFPGMRAPEPIAGNLTEQIKLMTAGGFDIGLSTDGDADRAGFVDEQGRFITQLQSYALLTYYLVAMRGERGPLVRSVTMTRMIDRIGERYGCPTYETPVGFVHLGPKMMETDALTAGEESGGYAFRGHVPERDGVLSNLLMLEAMVRSGKRPSELLATLYDEVGRHEYDRIDITLKGDERDGIRARVAAAEPEQIAGLRVESKDTVDGFRFNLEGGWWLLLRFSGTEPLLRIYAEMPSLEQVRAALKAGQELAGATL